LGGILMDNNLLTGTVPESLGYLNNLSFLELSNNQLSGIPIDMPRPPALNIFPTTCDLTGNKFICPIPDWSMQDCGAVCTNSTTILH